MKSTRSLATALVVVLSLATVSAQATFFNAGSAKKNGLFTKHQAPEAVPGEIIVGMNHTISDVSSRMVLRSAIAQVFGADTVASITSLPFDSSIQKVKIKDAHKTAAVISQLRGNGYVRYAEPNFIYHTLLAPGEKEPIQALLNDPEFAKQWDMKNTGQTACNPSPSGGCNNEPGTAGADINVTPLWDAGITGSKDMVVAVIDTGVDYNHPDLKDNIWTNKGEIAGNGIDDDGNGVIDDVHGANFSNETGVTGDPLDDHNHGTHCSGTIGAKGNDGVGISGVNWNVSIMGVKFLTASGSGSLEGALGAINYATKMGAKVMSNSWGGGGYSEALKEAIVEAEAKGILFVAAAGNSSEDNDVTENYPSNYEVPNVLAVAATDNQDHLAWFSNYGKTKVHVAAPGVAVYSTLKGGQYGSFSGTSMACPHISGMAALLWSANPNYTYQDIKDLLVKTSDPVRKLKSKVVAKGRADINNAYTNYVPPTTEPAESEWKTVAYSVESEHPYKDATNKTYEINVPGAKYIRVLFDKVELETGYDTVSIETPSGEVSETFTGEGKANIQADYTDGEKTIVRLKTDSSETRWGFKISQVQVVY